MAPPSPAVAKHAPWDTECAQICGTTTWILPAILIQERHFSLLSRDYVSDARGSDRVFWHGGAEEARWLQSFYKPTTVGVADTSSDCAS